MLAQLFSSQEGAAAAGRAFSALAERGVERLVRMQARVPQLSTPGAEAPKRLAVYALASARWVLSCRVATAALAWRLIPLSTEVEAPAWMGAGAMEVVAAVAGLAVQEAAVFTRPLAGGEAAT